MLLCFRLGRFSPRSLWVLGTNVGIEQKVYGDAFLDCISFWTFMPFFLQMWKLVLCFFVHDCMVFVEMCSSLLINPHKIE